MDWFLNDNGLAARFVRTIVQAVVGFVMAYINDIVNILNVGDGTAAIIVAAMMAILSPVMQMIGAKMPGEDIENGAH